MMSGKRTLYEIYLQDALSFERKYTEDYIEEIKTAFGPIPLEEKAEFLRIIRQKHLSRIFALTALAATKPTPEEFKKLAPKTIMHLGDVINFIEIYHKIHKEEPNQYANQLKKLIKEMPRTKTELYSYYSVPSEVEEYLEKHLGVTLANQILLNDNDPDNTAYMLIRTYQYKPLLMHVLTHLNDIKYKSTLEALSVFFADPVIVENLDIPPMTLALHFLEVAERVETEELDKDKATHVLGGLAGGLNHLLRKIANDPEKKDWNVVIFNTPEGRTYLDLPGKFKFYRDEISAVIATIAAGNNGRIMFISDGMYSSWVEKDIDYVKVFRRVTGLLSGTRGKLSFTGKVWPTGRNTLVILFDEEYLHDAFEIVTEDAMYYVISERPFFEGKVFGGFSERVPLLFAFPFSRGGISPED